MSEAKCDILTLIKNHHQILRSYIEVLKNENRDLKHLKIVKLKQFITLLKIHTEAEEDSLYKALRRFDDNEMMVCEAYEEHGIAKTLISELEDGEYAQTWGAEIEAKAKVLAEIVEHHLNEEEREIFEQARRDFAVGELFALGAKFQTICDRFETYRSGRAS